MAKLQRTTISRRTVDRLKADRDTVFWDSELQGFGLRIYPSGRKAYIVQTRAGGADGKRVTVGRHGVISPEEARERAMANIPLGRLGSIYEFGAAGAFLLSPAAAYITGASLRVDGGQMRSV